MAERVLVTGATGFVGRAVLAPLVARGFEVHGVARTPAAAGGGVTWHAADLLAPGTGRLLMAEVRPHLLVHAAWYVVHGRFWTAPENEDWLEASTELAAAFVEAGGRRLIGIGSCAEYAAVTPSDGLPWPETRPIDPATAYGRAKAALADRLAAMAGRHGRFDHAWARLFHLFGPGEHPDRLVPSVFGALLAGHEAACGSGRPIRDFASTGFVGRALASLAASSCGGAVNVASGQAIAIGDLVGLLARLAGRPDLVRLGRLPDRPGEVAHMVADIGRLRRGAGFHERADLAGDLAGLLRLLSPA